MNNNNFENAMGQVMEGQEVAQRNMVGILKGVFDFVGINTNYLSVHRFAKVIEQVAMGGFLESAERCRGKQYAEQLIERSTETFNVFLQMSDEGIEELNTMPLDYRYGFFCQVFTFLSYNHAGNRPELLNDLLQLAVKYKDTKQDMVSARAWMLFMGLLVPNMAA